MLAGLSMPSAGALSTSVNPALSADGVAQLTAKSGEVWKQDFIDWQKEIWGPTQEASVNDRLREGMRLGTGNNSWAEVSWPDVKTRVWANSQFAVAPNKRLVYLSQGEMLFRLDKHRKDKEQPYYIWTKVLQARIRGTTVLVQAQNNVTRFTVLEGVVEVLNKLDHSQVTLRPGVVYEIVGHTPDKPSAGAQAQPAKTQPAQPSKAVTDILYDKADSIRVPLFYDNWSSSNIYPANSQALTNHPLIKAGGLIDSMPLIEKEQKDLPGFIPALPIRTADEGRLSRLVHAAVEVKLVPTNADYYVGEAVGKSIFLPQLAATDLPPKGVILTPKKAMPIIQAKAPVAAPPPMIFPQDGTEAAEAPLTAECSMEADAQPPQLQEFADAALQPIGVGGQIGSQTAGTGAVLGQVTGGLSGAVGGLTGSMGATVGGLTGAVGGLTGSVGGTVGGMVTGVTGSLGGTASQPTSVLSPVSNTVNSLTSALTSKGTVTNTVTNVLGGLGRL